MALDLTGVKTAPKAPPAKRTPRAKPATGPSKQAERAEGLRGFLGLVSVPIAMFGGETGAVDGIAITKHGENISNEAAALAENNVYMARTLDYICAVGPFAGLLAASIPLALQIMANHKRISASALPPELGIVEPQLLLAEAHAATMRQQAQAMQRHREAMAEIERLQRDAENYANGEA